MRGRIRQLKPDLFLDEEFWALDEAHLELHLLRAFEGIWCQADREGRFEWRPAMLKSQILPYWGGDFSRVLEVLRLARYVVRYEANGRSYGYIRNFHKHQRPNNREPISEIPEPPLEHAQVCSSPLLESAEATRASQLPTPNSQLPTPNPDQLKRPERPAGSGGVARTYSIPSEVPPKAYLDEAVMRGVSPTQAESTWKHYYGAGLPERGVERLYEWLCSSAIERSKSQAKAAATPTRGRGSGFVPQLEPTKKHRAYAKAHGIEDRIAPIVAELVAKGVVEAVGVHGALEELGKRLSLAARETRGAA